MLKKIRKIETKTVDEDNQGYKDIQVYTEDSSFISWESEPPEVGEYIVIERVSEKKGQAYDRLRELKNNNEIEIPDQTKTSWVNQDILDNLFGGTDGDSDPRRRE